MIARVIEAERELENELRATAKEALGSAATKEEIDACASEMYHGRESVHHREETAVERRERERETARELARIDRWGVPEP